MRYVKNVLVAEFATIGIGLVLTMIAAIAAVNITGISDFNAACEAGYHVGIVAGVLLRVAMLIVFAVTIVKTAKEG